MTLAEAKTRIRERMALRESRFLSLLEKGVFSVSSNPFCVLLKAADISLSDIKQMVAARGLEGALEELRDRGVYLTLEEFKGERSVLRFNQSFVFREEDFDNPYLGASLETVSGASRSSGTRTLFDTDFLTEWACYDALLFDMYDIYSMPLSIWLPGMPAYAGIRGLLSYTKIGKNVDHWFLMHDKSGLQDVNKINDRFMRYVLKVKEWSGRGKTTLGYAPLSRISDVLHWVVSNLGKYGKCAVFSYVSNAVRLCLQARRENVSIQGVIFIIGSEPLTTTKQKIIEDAGCIVAPRYVVTEFGPLAYACKEARGVDRMHLLQDSIAVIQGSSDVDAFEGKTDGVLFATNLLPTASKFLVNVETGDRGILSNSDCQCPWHRLGFALTVCQVTSYKKITVNGVTFSVSDIVDSVERLLIKTLCIDPVDFQLTEQEVEGVTQIVLFISPSVEVSDEKISSLVLDEIASINSRYKFLVSILRDGNIWKIVRKQPRLTARGKLLHFAMYPA